MKKTTIFIILATILILSGCKENGNKEALIANEWQLTEMTTGSEQVTLPTRMPTLELTDTNTIYGFSGCNRFFGRYTTEGYTISVEPGGSTMMACPDMEFEERFIKALATITSYVIKDEVLTLRNETKDVTLVFEPRDTVSIVDDDHGCQRAAGFTWSEVKKDCIRLFELGVRLANVKDSTTTMSAFVVFSIDSLQAEIFIPNMETHPVLERRALPNGGFAWNVEDDDTYNVRRMEGHWVIEQREEILFVETPEK